ncbi:hypothetical protein NUU61_008169 [Penicillium alfredii]|uniref:SprT-like domain-containing protein n=1 Tax=Penicillium alfredii TaxID=1506179 RepID=A0A9W9ERY4_9EURO|nr:uncharacterized protein NUU61_008169 [Penicillium alfredii]KAJ5086862.1 hypothetical protein NUU61_008169 [Penicillium alfredii]
MARLNTIPQSSDTPHRTPGLYGRPGHASPAFADSPISRERTTRKSYSTTKGRTAMSPHETKKAKPSAIFNIFSDADDDGDDKDESAHNSSSPHQKPRKSRTLNNTQVNSLLLPHPTTSRYRPMHKLETADYDKENDRSEDEYPVSTSPSFQEPIRSQASQRNMQRTPTRSRTDHRSSIDPLPARDETDNSSDNNSFHSLDNSLDDFIVSDNEELSYDETSDSETDDQVAPPPSPPTQSPRKRLLRGRRPNTEADEIKDSATPSSPKEHIPLEPSLPELIKTRATKLDTKPRRLFQHNSIAKGYDQIPLDEDNEPLPPLETELPKSEPEHGPSSLQLTPPRQHPEALFSSPSPNRLRSPTKEKNRIPPTPHRENVDAFWSQEVTNDWIDQHSPRKDKSSGGSVFELLREFEDSDYEPEEETNTPPVIEDDSDIMSRDKKPTTPKTPSKTALKKAEIEQRRALRAQRASFDQKKASFAENFLQVLDDAVADGEVTRLATKTGGVQITWNKTLKTTAGRAQWRGDKVLTPEGLTTHHYASIELAERIIDSEDRLLNTLAHEYCHLANFMISNVHGHPHGSSFKRWGYRCSDMLKDHPVYGGRIVVTTKHNYAINFKYVWACQGCTVTYGRHSKSIKPESARCGVCRGELQQIKPKPRNVSPKKNKLPPPVRKGVVDDVANELGAVTL